MLFDVKSILADIKMPDADQAEVMAMLGKYPDAVKAIETKIGSFSSSVETETTALSKKREELDAEWEALKSYRGNDQSAFDELQTRSETLAAQVAIGEQRVRKACMDAGLDPAPYLKDLTAAPVVKKEEPVETTMDAAKIIQTAGTLAWNGTKMSAHLFDLAQEHHTLFGKPLTNTEGLLDKLSEEARRTNNPHLKPRDIWMKEYKVEAFKETKRAEELKAKEDAAFARGQMAERDANALRGPGGTAGDVEGAHSPIFASLKPGEGAVTVQGVPEAVSAAIIDFRKRRQAA